MGKRTVQVSSVILRDENEHMQTFVRGHEFDTVKDRHWVEQCGDHIFAKPEPDYIDLEKLTVPELIELAGQHGANPKSNRKSDLIEAIYAVAGENDAVDE